MKKVFSLLLLTMIISTAVVSFNFAPKSTGVISLENFKTRAAVPNANSKKISVKTMKKIILKGYWCCYYPESKSMQLVKFKNNSIGRGYKEAVSIQYHVKNGKFIKDNYIDNCSIINYKVQTDRLLCISEGGEKSAFCFTGKKNVLYEKVLGPYAHLNPKRKFIHFNSIPSYNKMKKLYT